MEIAGFIAAFVVVPTIAGAVLGAVIRPGDGYRQTAAVAGFGALGIVFVVLVIGFAITPEKQCVKESCDNGYAIGAIFMYPPIFGLAFLGSWLARLSRARTSGDAK